MRWGQAPNGRSQFVGGEGSRQSTCGLYLSWEEVRAGKCGLYPSRGEVRPQGACCLYPSLGAVPRGANGLYSWQGEVRPRGACSLYPSWGGQASRHVWSIFTACHRLQLVIWETAARCHPGIYFRPGGRSTNTTGKTSSATKTTFLQASPWGAFYSPWKNKNNGRTLIAPRNAITLPLVG
jgi:hypothetical protein